MAGQGRHIWWLVALLAMVAAACGNGTIVVSGPSVERDVIEGDPAAAPSDDTGDDADDDADESSAEIEFVFDDGLLGGDDESDPGDEDAEVDDEDSGGDDAEDEESIDGAPAGATMLRQAAADTVSAGTYRFEMTFGMEVSAPGTSMSVPNTPMTQGAVSGDRTWMLMDMGPIFDAVFEAAGSGSASALLGNDLSMEVLSVGTDVMYLRAPLFAAMADLGALPGAEDLAVLEDGWGRIDLAAAGISADDLGAMTGAQTGASADELLALVDHIGGSVTDLGAAEIRGVRTTHYLAEISLADVLDAQGMSAADLGGFSAGDAVLPVDVHVDAASRIRRIGVTIDTDLIADLVGESEVAGVTFRVSSIIDFYDFGAEITIVDGSELGAVDVTDAFLALAGS